MFKILGTDDSVNSCECCGKSNLKFTVIVEIDGEIKHFGSTCATYHTGLTATEIKNSIKAESDGRKEAASKKFNATLAVAKLAAKQNQARKNGLIGKAFKEFCNDEIKAVDLVQKEIAIEFNLEIYEVR